MNRCQPFPITAMTESSLNRSQLKIFNIPKEHSTVVFVAPLGSGKSYVGGVCTASMFSLLRDHTTLLMAQTRTQLFQTLEGEFLKSLARDFQSEKDRHWRYDGSHSEYKNIHTNSRVRLSHYDKDAYKAIMSEEFSDIIIEEAFKLKFEDYQYIQGRIRSRGLNRLILLTNAQAPLHWIKKELIDKGAAYVINCDYRENQHNVERNAPGYYERQKRLLSPNMYRRLILNEWVSSDGLVFDSYDPDKNVVSEIKENITHYIAGLDFGLRNETAFTLLGISERNGREGGNVYVLDCYKEGERASKYHIAKIKRIIQEQVPQHYKLPIVADYEAAQTIKDYQIEGLNLVNCIKKEDSYTELWNALNEGKFRILKQHLPMIEEEFLSLRYDDRNQNSEKIIKENDHLIDSIRYACYKYINLWRDYTYKPHAQPTETDEKNWFQRYRNSLKQEATRNDYV